MKWNKWINGGLGFVIAGPIGAIIGFIIGSVIDNTTPQKQDTQNTSANDFLICLLVLIAAVMKADNKVLKSELQVVKQFLLKTYGEEKAIEALQFLKQLLNEPIDSQAVAKQVAQNLPYSARLELINLLLSIANADNEFVESEAKLILRIAQDMGISQADYTSLLSLYSDITDKEWAYKALEITTSATNEEIKKAYRRMAMKFHPDKVNNMGEEIKRSATERFRKINEAYKYLKEERNF